MKYCFLFGKYYFIPFSRLSYNNLVASLSHSRRSIGMVTFRRGWAASKGHANSQIRATAEGPSPKGHERSRLGEGSPSLSLFSPLYSRIVLLYSSKTAMLITLKTHTCLKLLILHDQIRSTGRLRSAVSLPVHSSSTPRVRCLLSRRRTFAHLRDS